MLTTKDLIRRANKLWSSPTVPANMNRINKRKWIKSVQRLGDKWLLAVPVTKIK